MTVLLTILAVAAFQALGTALSGIIYRWGEHDRKDAWARLMVACAWPVIFPIYSVSSWRFRRRNARLRAQRRSVGAPDV
jgi:hypothetical protein